MADKQTYLREIEARLNEARAKMDELRAALSGAGQDPSQHDKRLEELSRRLGSLEDDANRLRGAKEDESTMDLKTGLEEAWNAFKAGLSVFEEMGRRSAYVQDLESRMREGREKIRELEAKADQAKGDARERYRKQVAVLKSKLALAEDKVKEIRAARAEAWGSLKGGVDDAWHDLKRGLSEALSQYK